MTSDPFSIETSALPPADEGIITVAFWPASYEDLSNENANILIPFGSDLFERPRHEGQSI